LADAIRAADAVIIIHAGVHLQHSGCAQERDRLGVAPPQPFKEKPVAIQSSTGGPLGGARMQYHLRQAMIFLNAFSFGTPELFVGQAPTKFDEKTLLKGRDH
jgi:chromate reductase